MKDPKVQELVKEFEQNIKALNSIWAKLQKENVYVRVDQKGDTFNGENRRFEIHEITQSISYASQKKDKA